MSNLTPLRIVFAVLLALPFGVAAANAERVMLVCANPSSQPIQFEIAPDGAAVVVRNRAAATTDYFPLISSAQTMADVLTEELRRQGYRCRREASDDAGPG